MSCTCRVIRQGATATLYLCPEAPAWMWARSTDGQLAITNLVIAPPEPRRIRKEPERMTMTYNSAHDHLSDHAVLPDADQPSVDHERAPTASALAMELVELPPAPLLISDMAQRTGVAVWRIRDLETKGLLPRAPRNAKGERIYTEEDAAAIIAAEQTAKQRAAPPFSARPHVTVSATLAPVPLVNRQEILFCRLCGRQLQDGEHARTTEVILATDFGSLITEMATCIVHDTPVALKTEFVAPGRTETSE